MDAKVESRNVKLYLAGKAVSQSGTALYTFAAGWHVLAVTGSAASFGLTLALGILPMVLVMPLAGVLADRLDRKRMVVGMDVLNGLWFLGMGLFAALNGLSLGAVYVTAVVTTVLTTLFSVSLEASKLALVTGQRLMGLNASSRVVESVVSVAGPVFGGLVYGCLGIEAFLWINGISFLLSAFSERWMRFEGLDRAEGREDQKKTAAWSALFQALAEGWSAVWSDSELKALAWKLMAINFFIGLCVSVPLPYVLHRGFEEGERILGLVQGVSPVGVILGALLLNKLKWSYEKSLKAAGILLTVSFGLLGTLISLLEILSRGQNSAASSDLSFVWIGLVPAMLLLGVGIAWIDLPLMYHFQMVVPERLKGRVLSVVMSLAKLALPVALLSAGALVSRVPAGLLTLVGGVFYLATLMGGTGKSAADITRRRSFFWSFRHPQ